MEAVGTETVFHIFRKTDPENHPSLYEFVSDFKALDGMDAITRYAAGNYREGGGPAEFMAVAQESVTLVAAMPTFQLVKKEKP